MLPWRADRIAAFVSDNGVWLRAVRINNDEPQVETLTTNRSNEPFDERILPRRTWGRQNLLDLEPSDTPVEVACMSLLISPVCHERPQFDSAACKSLISHADGF